MPGDLTDHCDMIAPGIAIERHWLIRVAQISEAKDATDVCIVWGTWVDFENDKRSGCTD